MASLCSSSGCFSRQKFLGVLETYSQKVSQGTLIKFHYAKHSLSVERQCHWMVPFGRNLQFVGRQDKITKLEELIMNQHGPTKIAISGIGRVGKTQVALELAHHTKARDVECSIFWIPCTSPESVEQAYRSIARIVGIQEMKPAEEKD